MQRDDQWRKDRAGKITGSRMVDVLATSKRDGKPLKARHDYLYQIVTERLTGEPTEGASARALSYGIDVEPHGLASYEAETGLIVAKADFIVHPTVPYVGASPDGLVGDDGGVEAKCPINSCIHLETVRGGMPEEHYPQVQCNLWVTGRKWWDFISYDPRMPEHLRLYCQRVLPDQKFIEKMAKACEELNDEAATIVAYMMALKEAA